MRVCLCFSIDMVVSQVYTLADESRHLLIFGVPKIDLKNEVKRLFEKCGTIESIRLVSAEIFVNKTGVSRRTLSKSPNFHFHLLFQLN